MLASKLLLASSIFLALMYLLFSYGGYAYPGIIGVGQNSFVPIWPVAFCFIIASWCAAWFVFDGDDGWSSYRLSRVFFLLLAGLNIAFVYFRDDPMPMLIVIPAWFFGVCAVALALPRQA